MNTLKFLGIHTGSLPPENNQKVVPPVDRPYWYIWFNQSDQNYIIQALNQSKQAVSTPVIISSLIFGLNFMEEKGPYSPPPSFPNVSALKHYEPTNTTGYAKTNIAINTKDESDTSPIADDAVLSGSEKNITLNIKNLDDEGEALLKPKSDVKNKINNSKALRLDKECYTDFKSAMDMWKQGRKGVASVKFDSLLKKDAPFIEAHKHMFTECAIQLRKIFQNDLALAYAMRCITLSPKDSHTYFNVGRMYYELKNYKSSLLFIEDALKLEPNLTPALKLKQIETDILKRVTKHRLG